MEASHIATALAGGVLIGLSASGMLLTIGRVMGVTGIFSGLLMPKAGEIQWRLMFVAGMLAGGIGLQMLGFFEFAPFEGRSLIAAAVGGLLVGVGTRVGGGCTSGHGVCGISRMSPRSIVGTMSFMIAGMVIVFIVNHILGGL
jgi:uncharacterized membrane protein YedE/YeeE